MLIKQINCAYDWFEGGGKWRWELTQPDEVLRKAKVARQAKRDARNRASKKGDEGNKETGPSRGTRSKTK